MLIFSYLPDPDEAQDLLTDELTNPRYAEVHASWWDRFVTGIVDFVTGLFSPVDGAGAAPIVAIILITIFIALVVVAFVVWGRPRLRESSRATPVGALFSDDDDRTSAELREAAIAAARAQRFTDAVVLRTRAIARSLAERGIVLLTRGATVQQFARHATRAFPQHDARLEHMARGFDSVRYLRVEADADTYQSVAQLDEELIRTRPAMLADLATVDHA